MQKIKGMTFVGMLLTMAVVVLAGIVVMRVVPVYLEYYSIKRSINSLNTLPEAEVSTDPAIGTKMLRSRIEKQLYIDGINLTPKQLKVVPNGKGQFNVVLNYQIIKPLFSNISLLFDFNETHEVNPGAG